MKLNLLADGILIHPTINTIYTAKGYGPGKEVDIGLIVGIGISALSAKIRRYCSYGDKVVYQKNIGTKIKINDEDYVLIKESDILQWNV